MREEVGQGEKKTIWGSYYSDPGKEMMVTWIVAMCVVKKKLVEFWLYLKTEQQNFLEGRKWSV